MAGDNWIRGMVAESVGTFAYVFFFMMQSENKDVVSEIETIQCLTLAASFIAAQGIVIGGKCTNYGAILNPAISLATFILGIFKSADEAFKWCWLFPTMPFAGAIMAIMFFEFIYKPSIENNTKEAAVNGKGLVMDNGGEHEDVQM